MRPGDPSFGVLVHDASPNGCRIEFVSRPRLGDKVRVKFQGLEALSATVCWIENFIGGVEFERPLHPAVFELLVNRNSGHTKC